MKPRFLPSDLNQSPWTRLHVPGVALMNSCSVAACYRKEEVPLSDTSVNRRNNKIHTIRDVLYYRSNVHIDTIFKITSLPLVTAAATKRQDATSSLLWCQLSGLPMSSPVHLRVSLSEGTLTQIWLSVARGVKFSVLTMVLTLWCQHLGPI